MVDPDQARLYAGPGLGPNCLQKLSTDNTIIVGKEFTLYLQAVHAFVVY